MARRLPPRLLDPAFEPLTRIVILFSLSRVSTALFATTFVLACSTDAAPTKRTPSTKRAAAAEAATAKIDDSAGSVNLGSATYSPGGVSAVGSIAGTIKLDGPAPPDTTTISVDQPICGTTPEAATVATAKGVSNAIVWIAGVKTGKDLPVEKRADVSSEKCAIDPRVQAVVVGTTVNVYNEDRLIHTLTFIRGAHDTLTHMPFFNSGQVVASERLATKPGIVEVRCGLHPWTRGYIAVFDHPYFTVTDANGGFTIDSLAPGTYKMMVWHEGMAQPATQQVQVAANGSTKVDLAIRVAR
jgi:plastocyanin